VTWKWEQSAYLLMAVGADPEGRLFLFSNGGFKQFLATKIYRRTEGPDWHLVWSSFDVRGVWSLATDGTNAYAVTDRNLMVSHDAGLTWTPTIPSAASMQLAVGDAVYLLVNGGGVRASDDAGRSWRQVDTHLTRVVAIAASGPHLFLSDGNNIELPDGEIIAAPAPVISLSATRSTLYVGTNGAGLFTLDFSRRRATRR
jgi:hypothetical protein